LQPKNRPNQTHSGRERARKLLTLQTRPTTDLSPETKRLLAEAKATNFGKPVKPVPLPKKTKTMEFQEAKARLMDTKPSKREQKLIDFHLQRAAELEKAGNRTEAAFNREHAETVQKNCIAIREVFAENVAKHEKEIRENLAKPIEVIRAERKAKEAATAEKMREIIKRRKAKKGTK
jgi:hypothetical protein